MKNKHFREIVKTKNYTATITNNHKKQPKQGDRITGIGGRTSVAWNSRSEQAQQIN